MDIAIGIRRAVMQHELGTAFASFPDFLVKILFLPCLEHQGLAFGEIAAHGEGRIGQIKRFFIVGHEVLENSDRQFGLCRDLISPLAEDAKESGLK